MNQSAKITILGAGAIGCTMAVRLKLAGCTSVSIIARGENYQVLSEQGIYLQDLTGEHHIIPDRVVSHASALEPQDVIFIATKSDALIHVYEDIQSILHEQTLVIPLINGIPFWYFYQNTTQDQIKPIKCLDADQRLIQHFPLSHLIGAVVFITATLKSHGRVESKNPYLLILGEPSHQVTPRITALQNIFTDSGIEVRISETIRDQIWTKVIANLSSNPMSVITGATLKDIYSHPYLQSITREITREVRQVAASYGARVSIDPDTFLKLGSEMGDTRTSMWYDYQKKQPLELKGIADAVIELAEHYDCPMPMTRHICDLTQYLSEQSRKI
ncbi:ketopantoate reductase family protein [Acinetobacter soli]|uniref:ketopantoate reductase family protein n=1 Tax=Acinetobacter soli TaxID=487316 RepID=UPI00125F6D8E|nr:2-dehydropantoate 2-reductase [Acinetobacter soli]